MKKLESEAAVSKEVNEAQAEKLRAEAGAAEQVAGGAKAQACSARMKLLTENMVPGDFSDDGKTIKPGTQTARMMDKYERDCGAITGATSGGDSVDDSELQKAITETAEQYEGTKKADMDGRMADDVEAGLDASCLIGVRIGSAWTLHDEAKAKEVTLDGIITCMNAAASYKSSRATHAPLDGPGDLPKAADAVTRSRWGRNLIVADVKRCVDQGPDYAGYLACGCLADARYGAARVLPDADKQAWQDFVDKSDRPCRRLSAKFAEMDGSKTAEDYRRFLSSAATGDTPAAGSSAPKVEDTKPPPPPVHVAEAEPAPASSPSPPALRTPKNFDCVNGKHMGADWVICASPELLDMEAQLEDAYRAALAARGDFVRHEEIQWIKDHGTDCGLPYKGRPAPERIAGARDCIMANMKQRLAELQAEQ